MLNYNFFPIKFVVLYDKIKWNSWVRVPFHILFFMFPKTLWVKTATNIFNIFSLVSQNEHRNDSPTEGSVCSKRANISPPPCFHWLGVVRICILTNHISPVDFAYFRRPIRHNQEARKQLKFLNAEVRDIYGKTRVKLVEVILRHRPTMDIYNFFLTCAACNCF